MAILTWGTCFLTAPNQRETGIASIQRLFDLSRRKIWKKRATADIWSVLRQASKPYVGGVSDDGETDTPGVGEGAAIRRRAFLFLVGVEKRF